MPMCWTSPRCSDTLARDDPGHLRHICPERLRKAAEAIEGPSRPHKRPRSSWIRFEARLSNECWQSDVTHWRLGDGTEVEIVNLIWFMVLFG